MIELKKSFVPTIFNFRLTVPSEIADSSLRSIVFLKRVQKCMKDHPSRPLENIDVSVKFIKGKVANTQLEMNTNEVEVVLQTFHKEEDLVRILANQINTIVEHIQETSLNILEEWLSNNSK